MTKQAIYADFGLVNSMGHHAQSCFFFKAIANELGIKVISLVHKECQPNIATDLQAHKVLYPYTYESNSTNNSTLNEMFTVKANETLACLRTLPVLGISDLIFFNSVSLPIFRAIIEHLHRGGFGKAQVIVEIGHALSEDSNQKQHRLSLHQYLAKRIREISNSDKLSIGVFSKRMKSIYHGIYGDRLKVFSALRTPLTDSCSSSVPTTVGFLGHQFPHKGYQLIPEIHSIVSRRTESIEWIIHTSNLQETHLDRRVRDYFDDKSNCYFVREECWIPRWKRLLEAIDIVVLPYDPSHYSQTYSAIAWECALNRRGVVLPNGTTLESDLSDIEYPFVGFHNYDSLSVANAISESLLFYQKHETQEKMKRTWDALKANQVQNSVLGVLKC